VTNRTAIWFVRRATDDRILCIDRLWRNNAGCVESIKFYSSAGRAHRYGLKGQDGTAYAVYPGDCVDCLGNVGHNRLADCAADRSVDVRNGNPLSIGRDGTGHSIKIAGDSGWRE